MGKAQSKEAAPAAVVEQQAAAQQSAASSLADRGNGAGGRGCPMKRGNGGGGFGAMFGRKNPHRPGKDGSPGLTTAAAPREELSGGGCPIKAGGSKSQQAYNVYSQPIDPTNQMPAVANQLPAPGQKESLPTEREQSTIPKGGTEGTWTYPSPQMFYNSLARKNKLGETTEEDIVPVVALHNNMNEKTWAKVLEWEAVLNPPSGEGGEGPKLLKFLGRPSDLSPKAMFKNWILGHPLPFDRHDWTVIRPDGTEVRYVIDYYHDETRAKETEGSGMPDMHDRDAVKSILVDVRPALDSPSELLGRMAFMPYARRVAHSTSFTPLPMLPTLEMKDQLGESIKVWDNIQENARRNKAAGKEVDKPKVITVARDDEKKDADVKISAKEATELAKSFASALKGCQEARRTLDACKDDEECARASLALTVCMGKIICPLQHDALTKSLSVEPTDAKGEAEYNARVDAALENIAVCVGSSNERASMAKRTHPEAFA
jgi:cytochrome c heme-lyase